MVRCSLCRRQLFTSTKNALNLFFDFKRGRVRKKTMADNQVNLVPDLP